VLLVVSRVGCWVDHSEMRKAGRMAAYSAVTRALKRADLWGDQWVAERVD